MAFLLQRQHALRAEVKGSQHKLESHAIGKLKAVELSSKRLGQYSGHLRVVGNGNSDRPRLLSSLVIRGNARGFSAKSNLARQVNKGRNYSDHPISSRAAIRCEAVVRR